MVSIHHQDNGTNGRFYLTNQAGFTIGEIDYVWEGKHLINVVHTGVNPIFEGEGFGKKLVDALVDFAKKKDLKIIPSCPFVASLFEAYPDTYNQVNATA